MSDNLTFVRVQERLAKLKLGHALSGSMPS